MAASTCIEPLDGLGMIGLDVLYHPPVKRSVEIAGHKTSISLEPLFWDLLKRAALAEGVPINALVARIDAERIAAETPPGLASALRLWLAARLQPAEEEAGCSGNGDHFQHAALPAEQQERGRDADHGRAPIEAGDVG